MIVGIDSGSRRLAVCKLSVFGDAEFCWYEAPATTSEEEIRDLCWWLAHTAGVRNEDSVWLEPTVVGVRGGVQNALRHSMTIGGVLATVGGTLVPPSTWKASILGHGSADKEDIADWVHATSDEITEAVRQQSPTRKDRRQDLYDAYCIALHGDLAWRHPDQLVTGRRVPRRRTNPRG